MSKSRVLMRTCPNGEISLTAEQRFFFWWLCHKYRFRPYSSPLFNLVDSGDLHPFSVLPSSLSLPGRLDVVENHLFLNTAFKHVPQVHNQHFYLKNRWCYLCHAVYTRILFCRTSSSFGTGVCVFVCVCVHMCMCATHTVYKRSR